MRFVFYDTETTGLHKQFEQILQFAAVEADDDLQIVEAINLRCRRLPHIVPSPGALLTTGIRCEQLETSNVTHYAMTGDIQDWLVSRCPAVLVGHNNLSYDETLIRQAFYQTLRPVYVTNTGGNTRGDTLVMAHATAVYAPERIQVPEGNNGRRTFRLGPLVRANGISFDEDSAHEASADVRATLELARFIRHQAPHVWSQMLDNADKAKVNRFLARNDFFPVTFIYAGTPYTYVASFAGRNASDANEVAVFDLAFDPAPYLDMSVTDLVEVLNGQPKILRTLRVNAQPILMPYAFTPEGMHGERLHAGQYQARAKVIQDHPEFWDRVGAALVERREPGEVELHVEARIYDAFPTVADERRMRQFHTSPWEERYALADSFQDERLKELGRRLVFLEHPECVPNRERRAHERWLRDRLMTEDSVPWTTITTALASLNDLRNKHSGSAQAIDQIERYLHELAKCNRN